LLDMKDYIRVKDRMIEDYEDRDKWRRMMLINIARAGYFSSDRTVGEYNEEIWHLQGDKRPLEWI
ncbi:MAG: glycogen/starch/alpha-glucan phosphorylase, partial [Lachnospiraceae bacterium]|nr:glycogen/starch/alpha-glucan phosphorylase [Lachnospiraceae bacterium]